MATSKEVEATTEKYGNWRCIMSDYHSGNEYLVKKAKEEACKNLDGYIYYIIHNNFPTYIAKDIQDMVNCGYIGILKGLQKYDPSVSKPTTYFKNFIKHEISDYITVYKNGTTPHYASIIRTITAAEKYFESRNIPYNEVTISEYCSLPLASVKEAYSIKNGSEHVNFLDAVGTYTTDDMPDALRTTGCNVESEVEQNSVIDALITSVNSLTPDEQFVIINGYGIMNHTPMSQKAMAEALGVTIPRIKYLRSRALVKLRSGKLADIYDDKYDNEKWLSEEITFMPDEDSEVETTIIKEDIA